MFNVGLGAIPRVTFFTILGQVLLYLGVINVPWTKWDVCISADTVLKHKDYRRFIFSTFEHANNMHLYYNMVFFSIKGRTLENRYGSSNFALLLAFLTLLTNTFYIALAKFWSEFLEDYSMMRSCAIGFSGVLFALVITTSETGPGTAYIMGIIPVPRKYAAWAELVAIHLLVPNASFLGHLAGILAGYTYISTTVGRVVDYIIATITGNAPQPAAVVNADPATGPAIALPAPTDQRDFPAREDRLLDNYMVEPTVVNINSMADVPPREFVVLQRTQLISHLSKREELSEAANGDRPCTTCLTYKSTRVFSPCGHRAGCIDCCVRFVNSQQFFTSILTNGAHQQEFDYPLPFRCHQCHALVGRLMRLFD